MQKIFESQRDELLYHIEYVNVFQLFKHCHEDFIIRSIDHEHFDKWELARYCMKEKLYQYDIARIKMLNKLGREYVDYDKLTRTQLHYIKFYGKDIIPKNKERPLYYDPELDKSHKEVLDFEGLKEKVEKSRYPLDIIFDDIKFQNVEFTKYFIDKYNAKYLEEKEKNLFNRRSIINIKPKFAQQIIDYLNEDELMDYACNCNEYNIIRFMIKRRGVEWCRKFNSKFIEKYYL